jgi:hypothetical protein
MRLLTIIAVALGAFCSSWLMAFVYGGWKHGVLGYIAWALMPYAILATILLCSRLFSIDRSVWLLSAWASIVIALGGPFLYYDAMFVHVDAQGMLVVLMIPVIQTALSMIVAVVSLLWQWRISRPATKSFQKTVGKIRCMKLVKFILATSMISATIFYIMISMLQYKDKGTIDTAKEVDFYISQYCQANKRLPTSAYLHERFPDLSTNIGWFYFTYDKTWLKLQYPVRWRNSDAIGEPAISEFTATVYAYSIEYRCGDIK